MMQFQGTLICLLLGVGWAWSGVMRLREVERQRAAQPQQQRSSRGMHLPAESGRGLVFPVTPARVKAQTKQLLLLACLTINAHR